MNAVKTRGPAQCGLADGTENWVSIFRAGLHRECDIAFLEPYYACLDTLPKGQIAPPRRKAALR
jgi:hypothetical protein